MEPNVAFNEDFSDFGAFVEQPDKPVSIKVNLTPRTRQIVENIREDTGIPSTEATARLYEWFGALDRKLRLAILNRDTGTQQELVLLALKDLAGASVTLKDYGPLHELDLEQLVTIQSLVGQRIAQLASDYKKAALGGKGKKS